MRCQLATWKPVANMGPAMHPVLGLVVHVQEGNGSLQGWFNNPASQASSHFWVSKTGQLEQYVDTSVQAWAQAAGNANYLSVETEGFHTEPLEPAQISALSSLITWVTAIYLLPLVLVDHGEVGITTHAHYPSGMPDPAWGDHPCPGVIRTNQLPSVLAIPVPPPVVSSPRGDNMSAIVVKSTGNGSEWLADTTAGTIRYFPTLPGVATTLAALGQVNPAEWTPDFLSGFTITGPPGPGIGK